MSKKSVMREITALQKMDLPALRKRWRELFNSEPPRYSRVFMAKRLAYRVQELAYGGLSEATRFRMKQIIEENGFDKDGRPVGGRKRAARRKGLPVAGTRLVRDWEGQRYEVTVAQHGFEFEGRMYKSLSAIARAITGTRWNGPAFFGLRSKKAGT